MKKILILLFCLSLGNLVTAEENKTELTKLELEGSFKKVSYGTLFVDEKGEEFMLLRKPYSEVETILNEQVNMRVKVKQGENRRQIVYIASFEVIN
jgi:hypothetical protein